MLNYPSYRVKVVGNIKPTTEPYRIQKLKEAKYNLFNLKAEDVGIDLLTDSGTSAMSENQMAALMMGDESYAGSTSYHALNDAVKEIFAYKYFLPVHQGRAAENLVCGELITPGTVTISNTHFDTTDANVSFRQGEPINYPDLSDPIFPGNINLDKLNQGLQDHNVVFVIMTLTNNAQGGLPVSMENLRGAYELCQAYQVPLFIDGARMFENAFFVKRDEPGYQNRSIPEIVREMCLNSDGLMMSSKKDGLVNIGGLLCVNDEDLYERLRVRLAIQEGFVTYGGLSGRDMHALAVGLFEGMELDYLASRIGQIEYLGNALKEIGVPVVEPFGGSAVFIDAGELLPHIPDDEFPGHALAVELYKIAGIRSCEIGSVMFGPKALRQLLRLAIPRRVYLKEHLDAIVDAFKVILDDPESISGYRITEAPTRLRHFFASFEPINTPAQRSIEPYHEYVDEVRYCYGNCDGDCEKCAQMDEMPYMDYVPSVELTEGRLTNGIHHQYN